jgi:aspartyl protease family protein
MKRHLVCVLLTLFASATAGRAATPEETLKAKGLTKVGAFYVLEGDMKNPERLRAMRVIKHKMDSSATQRMKIEKEIDNAKATIIGCAKEIAALGATLPDARRQSVARHNEVVAQMNRLEATRVEGIRFIEARQKDLTKIADPSDDYINSVIDVSSKMEATAAQYEKLAADPEVKNALIALNDRPGAKVRLGPSPQFANELPAIRKLREMVRGAVIKLNFEGGVPHANITINNSLNIPMVVDTGASAMTLTADAAKKLNLKIDASNPTVRAVAADGKVTECKVVTLQSVRLGQFIVENVDCFVFPESVEGSNLLGGTFLRNFVSRMDLAARELHLTQVAGTKGTAPAGAAAGDGLSFTERHDRAIEQAEEAYARAIVAAKRDLIRDINEALKKTTDAAEVKKLEEAKKEAEEALVAITQPPEEDAAPTPQAVGKVTVQVNASDDWKEYFPVKKGEVLVISASGTWKHGNQKHQDTGPGGFRNDGYLEGRIGGRVFRINEGVTTFVEGDGVLSMRMNDANRTDNSGIIAVTITKKVTN